MNTIGYALREPIEAQLPNKDSCAGRLARIPVSLGANCIDTIVGAGVTLAAIAKNCSDDSINQFAIRHLDRSYKLLASPYKNLLRAVNPAAKYHTAPMGILTHALAQYFNKKTMACLISNNFYDQAIGSRLVRWVEIPARLVTRAADTLIGIPPLAISILSFGKWNTINSFASKQALSVTGIIRDMCVSPMRIINPQADLSSRHGL